LSTNLRLLIDADIDAEVVRKLEEISALNIDHALSHEFLKTDEEVMAYACEHERIVLTRDHGFCKKNYPICTHPGIIRFDCKNSHSSTLIEAFKNFSLSGHRAKANHAITRLLARDCFEVESSDSMFKYPDR